MAFAQQLAYDGTPLRILGDSCCWMPSGF